MSKERGLKIPNSIYHKINKDTIGCKEMYNF